MLHSQDSVTGLPAYVEVVGGALRVTSAAGSGGGGAVVTDPSNPLAQRTTETITVTPLVAAATAVQVAGTSTTRKTLDLANTGNNPLWFGYSSGTTAANGFPVPAGAVYSWGLGAAPGTALFAFSTLGTTALVKEGV